jgi:hypothetical protein
VLAFAHVCLLVFLHWSVCLFVCCLFVRALVCLCGRTRSAASWGACLSVWIHSVASWGNLLTAQSCLCWSASRFSFKPTNLRKHWCVYTWICVCNCTSKTLAVCELEFCAFLMSEIPWTVLSTFRQDNQVSRLPNSMAQSKTQMHFPEQSANSLWISMFVFFVALC